MLTYLLGDIIRIFAGDVEPGRINGEIVSRSMWLGIAIIMLVPIVMIVLTLIIDLPIIRWINIITIVVVIVFNIFGLPYKGIYDNFLIGVSFVINLLTLFFAWRWN